jgi:hypothetical protein
MRTWIRAALVLTAICSATASLASTPPNGSGGVLADLPNFKNFKAARFSSYDPTGGNADGRSDWPIKPGETRTIAQTQGAGAVVHLWFTIASRDTNHLKNLILRMYWDGESAPSVESPIGDFFGLGHARYYQFWSTPIQIGVDKGLNCFWRMPFTNGARVTVFNDGPLPVDAFYYYIDYQKQDSPAAGCARFHAQYRQTYPCPKGANYVILDAIGRGHYVGCNLSIHNRAGGWWGEGDDMIYVDGEEQPSLHGTGSEDYFCGAWCYGETFSRPFSGPYFGNPLNEGSHSQNALWNVYRYHIEDPIPFSKSIRVTIEHGHKNNRSDDFTSVAYWYQSEPHVPFPPMPKIAERLPTKATIFVEPYVYEGEDLAPAFQNPDVVAQSTLDYGNLWSSGAHLLVRAPKPGTYTAQVPTSASEAGTYKVDWWYTAGPGFGRCELWFNRTRICAWDGYQAGTLTRKKVDGPTSITVKPAGNILELRVTGKDPAAEGYHVGLDCYRVVP